MARTPAISAYPCFEATFFAEAAVKQYMAVKPGSDDHQITLLENGVDSDGIACLGIVQNDANANEAVRVVFGGPSKARADGSVSVLNSLVASASATADENGELVVVSVLANASMILAVALEDAADDEYFWANIVMQYQLATAA